MNTGLVRLKLTRIYLITTNTHLKLLSTDYINKHEPIWFEVPFRPVTQIVRHKYCELRVWVKSKNQKLHMQEKVGTQDFREQLPESLCGH